MLEDSFGPYIAQKILAHILDGLDLRPRFAFVSVLAPEQFGQTNIDTLTHLTAMVKAADTVYMLAIDFYMSDSLGSWPQRYKSQ